MPAILFPNDLTGGLGRGFQWNDFVQLHWICFFLDKNDIKIQGDTMEM